ncbi:MAG TPA: choice-of-anchor tandem repeat GloVer-containing protein, partial [Burkholderiaceae bacterium]
MIPTLRIAALAAAALLAAALPAAASAGDYQRIASLRHVTGMYPKTPLVQGPDGLMYGTTTAGDAHHGTVYRVDGFHQVTVLHAFAKDGSEGTSPSQLVLGSDGWFYGNTSLGGTTWGAIWRISPAGELQMLHSFPYTGSSTLGSPAGPMVRDAAGNLYVSLLSGGTANAGAIARLAPDGTLTVLHSFGGGDDGALAVAGLTLGPDGRLYGTTRDDGPTNSGTAFSIAMDGSDYRVLHEFMANTDGCENESPLAVGPDGALYGSTANCGPNLGGAVFRLTTDGAFSVLHAFSSDDVLGAFPDGGVSFGPDGTLYGVTSDGGAHGGGTVFT